MIDLVIARLKDRCPSLPDVQGIEKLSAISLGTAPKSGTCFVVPGEEQAEPSDIGMGGFRQYVACQVLVSIVLRQHDDIKGGKKVASFDAVKAEIESALAGWSTAPENELFQLVRGKAAPLANNVTLYVQTWQTSRYLEAFE